MSTPQGVVQNKFGGIGSSNPFVKDYTLGHIQETDIERKLRVEVAQLERATMMGSPDEAAMLGWLVRLINAKKVLEIGVFRGTTTLALAKAVGPDGQVIGVDITNDYIKNSWPSFDALGVRSRVSLRLGPGAETVSALAASPSEVGTFDFIFIDANKESYPVYYESAVALLRSGGVLAVDNVLWKGKVADPDVKGDEVTDMFRELNEEIKKDGRMDSILLPMADGVYFCRKK